MIMKYQIHKGTKQFGADVIFEDIQFEIRNTEKIRNCRKKRMWKNHIVKSDCGYRAFG